MKPAFIVIWSLKCFCFSASTSWFGRNCIGFSGKHLFDTIITNFRISFDNSAVPFSVKWTPSNVGVFWNKFIFEIWTPKNYFSGRSSTKLGRSTIQTKVCSCFSIKTCLNLRDSNKFLRNPNKVLKNYNWKLAVTLWYCIKDKNKGQILIAKINDNIYMPDLQHQNFLQAFPTPLFPPP